VKTSKRSVVSQKSLRAYAQEWLAAKAPEIAARTLYSYRSALEQLIEYLGPRAQAPITDLTKAEFLAYRNHLCATLRAQTVNNHLALLRMLFKSARRDRVCLEDPAEFVGSIRDRGNAGNKRSFSLAELEAVLSVADSEWRSLILFGLYTGQRLSDLVSLSWHNIDLKRNEVRLVTSKTSRTMVIPLAPALRSHIESLPTGEVPDAPLHPRAFAILSRTGKASALSNQFAELLAQAGLRAKPPTSHHGCGIGRNGRRTINELSFHSLRRTATTLLHEAGVADAVAQSLIGHSSKVVHDTYISVGREALERAVATLPKVLKGALP
jgi:integrase